MATSLNQQVPGATSVQPQTSTTGTSGQYQYLNKGWEDPLAQDIAKQYLRQPGLRTSMWNPAGENDAYRQLSELSAGYHQGGSSGGGYIDPLDPKNFSTGGVYSADTAQKMRDEYISRGGLGTAEQLAGTYKTPEQKAAADALAKVGGSGSSFALGEDVLNKMWR